SMTRISKSSKSCARAERTARGSVAALLKAGTRTETRQAFVRDPKTLPLGQPNTPARATRGPAPTQRRGRRTGSGGLRAFQRGSRTRVLFRRNAPPANRIGERNSEVRRSGAQRMTVVDVGNPPWSGRVNNNPRSAAGAD